MGRLYSTHDVSKLLQVDASTVAKWVDKGLLMAFRTPGGHRRVRAVDLRDFCISHRMPVPAELGPGKLKLLIVDDEKQALTALERSLRPYGDRLEVTSTTSGIDAVLRTAEEKPGALLVDIHIPDLNGLDVIRQLASRPALSTVRLVAITGRFSPKLEAEAKSAGALACLEKPVDVARLLALLGVSEQRATA